MTLTRIMFGSAAFLGAGSVAFRPYLTVGLALRCEVNHIWKNFATQQFSREAHIRINGLAVTRHRWKVAGTSSGSGDSRSFGTVATGS